MKLKRENGEQFFLFHLVGGLALFYLAILLGQRNSYLEGVVELVLSGGMVMYIIVLTVLLTTIYIAPWNALSKTAYYSSILWICVVLVSIDMTKTYWETLLFYFLGLVAISFTWTLGLDDYWLGIIPFFTMTMAVLGVVSFFYNWSDMWKDRLLVFDCIILIVSIYLLINAVIYNASGLNKKRLLTQSMLVVFLFISFGLFFSMLIGG